MIFIGILLLLSALTALGLSWPAIESRPLLFPGLFLTLLIIGGALYAVFGSPDLALFADYPVS